MKTRKQKTDIDVAGTPNKMSRQDQRNAQASGNRKQRTANTTAGSPAETSVQVLTPVAPNGQVCCEFFHEFELKLNANQQQVLKKKRSRLENVLNTMKLKCLDAQTAQEQPIDLTYLLSGRGARQRKTNCVNNNNSNSGTPCA